MSALVSVDLPAPGAPVMPDGVGLAARAGRRGGRPRAPARRPARRGTAGGPAPRGRRPGRPRAAGRARGPDPGALRPPPLLGDAVDPVLHDPLDAGLQGVGRRRARAARPDEVTVITPVLLVDLAEEDVTAVGLQGRPDGLDRLFHLLSHRTSFLMVPILTGSGPWAADPLKRAVASVPSHVEPSTRAACSRDHRPRAGRVRERQGLDERLHQPVPAGDHGVGRHRGRQSRRPPPRPPRRRCRPARPTRPTRPSAATRRRSSSTSTTRPSSVRPSTSRSARRSCSACCPTPTRTYHVHGYDLEKKAAAGVEATFEFTADKAGSFEVESHTTDKVLATLQVSLVLFAHQGGWDEMLMVLVPIALAGRAPARWPSAEPSGPRPSAPGGRRAE